MTELFNQEVKVFEAIGNIPPVEDLARQTSHSYKVSDYEQTVQRIVDDHDVIVVAGAYFGDEGKGKLTDAIANDEEIQIVARMNSGENAGHTVYHGKDKFIFHLIPSAVMVPDKICVIGPECVMDPVNFVKGEVGSLVKASVDYKDRLFIGNVHIVGPHHKILDFALNPPNSSTLMGMSYAHASKVMKQGLRLDDLFNSKEMIKSHLEKELTIYHALMTEHKKDQESVLKALREFSMIRTIPCHLFEFLESKNPVSFLVDLYEKNVVKNQYFPKRKDIVHLLRKALLDENKILIESPQSYWLSNATEKHWRSSTSAQTHAAGVLASSGIDISNYMIAVINIAKTPADSRVGIGANPSSFVPQNYFSSQGIENLDQLTDKFIDFDTIQKVYFNAVQTNGILKPTEFEDHSISEAIAIGCSRQFGEKGATTGKPRVTGLFDCVAAAYVCEEQGPYLSLSAMDRGDYFDKVGMTIAYVFHNHSGESIDSNGKLYKNGDIIKVGDPYPCDNVLQFCRPIIKIMDGWKSTPIGAGKRDPDDELPDSVQEFIGTIEDLTHFRVVSIGNGPDTKNMIYIQKS